MRVTASRKSGGCKRLCETHTLMSTFLSLAGIMVGKGHGLRPDEWGRANRALPVWDLEQRKWGVGMRSDLVDRTQSEIAPKLVVLLSVGASSLFGHSRIAQLISLSQGPSYLNFRELSSRRQATSHLCRRQRYRNQIVYPNRDRGR